MDSEIEELSAKINDLQKALECLIEETPVEFVSECLCDRVKHIMYRNE